MIESCYKNRYESLLEDYAQLKEFIINANEEDLRYIQLCLRVVEKMEEPIKIEKMSDILRGLE